MVASKFSKNYGPFMVLSRFSEEILVVSLSFYGSTTMKTTRIFFRERVKGLWSDQNFSENREMTVKRPEFSRELWKDYFYKSLANE